MNVKMLAVMALGVCCAWGDVVEPNILTSAARWFDASSPSYYETDAQGNVTLIRDRRGLGNATPLNTGRYATVGETNGVPAFLFGESGSGIDYAFLETNGFYVSINGADNVFAGYTGAVIYLR